MPKNFVPHNNNKKIINIYLYLYIDYIYHFNICDILSLRYHFEKNSNAYNGCRAEIMWFTVDEIAAYQLFHQIIETVGSNLKP